MRAFVCLALDRLHIPYVLDKGAPREWGNFDLAVLDVMLGGQSSNGMALAEEARAQNPDIKIVFVTGVTDDFNVELLNRLGSYIPKPLGPSLPMRLLRAIPGAGPLKEVEHAVEG